MGGVSNKSGSVEEAGAAPVPLAQPTVARIAEALGKVCRRNMEMARAKNASGPA